MTIPVSSLVSVQPSVIAAGGAALFASGLLLTTSTRIPLNGTNQPTVSSFPSGAAVASFFGPSSTEAREAQGALGLGSGYFGGFTGSNKLPAAMLIAQYNTAAVAAYLRGGNVSALTLAQLQALSGSLTVIMDGYSRAAASINLSSATSFSSAASLIQTGLNGNPLILATGTATIVGGTMTITGISAANVAIGQTVIGTGVQASTTVLSQISGTAGGTGTYAVTPTQTMSSSPVTFQPTPVVVSYDSVSGAFVVNSGITGAPSTAGFGTGTISTSLALTQITGAVVSQGAAAATPATFMNNLIVQNSNWVSFWTSFDPDAGVGNTVKQAFAAWKNTQNNRFLYACWDTDATVTTTLPAAASLGQLLPAVNDSGTALIWDATDLNLAAFLAGAVASIDFTQPRGRTALAFKSQPGLVASITDPTSAANAGGNPQVANNIGNGYSFYGAYGSATTNFVQFQRGFVTGPFQWIDSYVNQIVMNYSFQNALMTFLSNIKSVPYTPIGNSLIEAALGPTIQQFLTFGAFGPAPLSTSEIAQVNNAAGANISATLQSQGYYLQILTGTPAQRASRTSPPMTFWYIDLGSVQALNLASIELQ